MNDADEILLDLERWETEGEARERMVAGTPGANLRQGKSVERAAEAVNVSSRSVESAVLVAKRGAAELVEAV